MGTALEESPGLLPREAAKPKGPAPEGEGAARAQLLSSLSHGGRRELAGPRAPRSARY